MNYFKNNIKLLKNYKIIIRIYLALAKLEVKDRYVNSKHIMNIREIKYKIYSCKHHYIYLSNWINESVIKKTKTNQKF